MADTPTTQPADNTSPEEKELADKLMAELRASGVDVDALQAKMPAPVSPSAIATTPPPAPAPKPIVAPTPPPVMAVAPPPAPTPPSPAVPPPVPAIPPVPLPNPTPAASAPPSTSGLSEEVFVQSLDQKLSRLNDSTFFVIRINKILFSILTIAAVLLIWFWPLF